MQRSLTVAIVGFLSAAGALSGCRSGGGSLSKAEYVKQANAICGDESGWLTSQQANTVTLSPSFDSRWADRMKRLRKLRAPRADRAQVAKIWDEADQAFATWSAEVKSQGEFTALQDEPAIFHRTATLAAAYGLDNCGT
jgi:hypothetical protein